jgi:predicted GIY-YIG superfamily endonuclease
VPWVYILRCADNSLYIGATSDLDARLASHNAGMGSAYTSKRCPVTLAWHERFPTMTEALARERQLKRWTRVKKEALISGDMTELKRL